MKKIIYIYLLISANALLAQINKVASFNQSLSSEKKIIWQKPVEHELPEKGKFTFLVFKEASYNVQEHFFPVYSEQTSMPVGTASAEVKIINAVYEPLTDAEKNAISSYDSEKRNFISDEIKITTTISFIRKKPNAFLQFIPIRKNKNGSIEKLVSFSLQIKPVIDVRKNNSVSSKRIYSSHSVLQNGNWFKVAVTADGIYKMNGTFLKKLGMDLDSVKPANIRMYGNGGGQLPYANSTFRYDDLQENAIYVNDLNGNGKFDSTDYILFYGEAQHRWKYNSTDHHFHHGLNVYSDSTYYFITADLGAGKRIAAQNSSSATPTNSVSTFDDFQFHELEAQNLLKSGRQWFGETFDIINSYNFTFTFPNIDASSNAYAKVNVGARRDSPGTDFYWTVGSGSSNFTVPSVTTSNIYDTFYHTKSDTLQFSPSSNITVTISKTTPSPAIGWLDYIEVNVKRNLAMSASQLIFRDANSVGTGNISQFTVSNANSNLQVWEITSPTNAQLQQGNFSGNNFQFTLPTDSLREFIAFTGQSFLIPVKKGKIPNQDLHGLTQNDLLIVTYPGFIQQANALAELHRTQDNMNVAVVTTPEVFNEFSSGAQDVSAIRDFAKMFYDRAADSTQLPKYLLLFGRGSFDLKGTLNNTNFVPAYESANSDNPTLSYPSDDFYSFLDDSEGAWAEDGTAKEKSDIGVGRLPVKTTTEAQVVINKISKYTSVPGTIETGNSCSTNICYGFGDWMNVVTFCADEGDGGIHINQADQLAEKVRMNYKNYNVDKIYLDAYQKFTTPGGDRYPDATADLNRRVNKGCLIVNYTGHGGQLGWAHSRFLEIFDIESWTNQCQLPIFFTATCEFSRWDDPGFTSAGELTLLQPNGGGIGLMSTTRVVYSGPNFDLNQHFYDHTFVPIANGKMPRLGDLYMLTKRDIDAGAINQRNFSLLTDPALSLNYPKYSVATTAMNGFPINISQPDTAKALSKISVDGELHDQSGNLLSTFNGIIYPTVYDKAKKITTLSNDGPATSPAITFSLQKNILFKGKASVTNGKFSFSFIVPKDIAYNFGNGRISYFSHNGYEDASGYFENFIIGGTDTAAAHDTKGPDVKLYMNDEKFVYGGTTNTNPKIFAVLSDSSGINTAGTGIGHDISVVLDGSATQPFILNDYYESDMNNYKKGSVRYPLSNLAEGTHNVSLKVWDVYNNSSTSYTEFVVASSASLALKHVLNYPNPFTTKTSFYFEHNRCCTNMDVQVQVFTIAGKLIKTIQQRVNLEGFRSEPIDWDGTDDFGDKIGRGVYVYRLRVKTSSGETAEQYEKLVILK